MTDRCACSLLTFVILKVLCAVLVWLAAVFLLIAAAVRQMNAEIFLTAEVIDGKRFRRPLMRGAPCVEAAAPRRAA